MKAKLISALISTAILGTTANIAQAEFPSAPPANIQMEDGVPSIPGIEFSDEQKEELKELKEEARSRISEILTSEQQNDLRAAIEAGENPKDVMKSFNLSKEDKKELQSIQKWQRKQLFGILNNEQKRKLMQMRQRQKGGFRFNLRG